MLSRAHYYNLGNLIYFSTAIVDVHMTNRNRRGQARYTSQLRFVEGRTTLNGRGKCSGCAENSAHELIVVDLDPSIAVGVESLEGLRQGLDNDARAHEAVEGDSGRRGPWHLYT